MHFDQAPYFDDFDSSKHFMKMLFRPSRPIQARELNGMQSILKQQIADFGNHVFKNGSKISDARSSFVRYNTLRVEASVLTPFLVEGCVLTGDVSEQKARFIIRYNNEICIEYIGSNSTGNAAAFFQSESVTATNTNNTILGSFNILNDPMFASNINIFVVEKGVFYYNGQFIENGRQILAVDLTDNFDIGFQVTEKIVSPADDNSLLDNNTSVMSYSNPGADRYSVHLSLTIKDSVPNVEGLVQNLYDVKNGFITLASVSNGQVSYIRQDTEYANLGDTLANRTYEESGNYTISPFKLELKNHLATSSVDGTGLSVDGSEENYVACVGVGRAYVKGYRVETVSKTNLISRKARDTSKQAGFIKQFEAGTSIKAIPRANTSVWPNIPSSILINDGSDINLYDGVLSGGNLPTGSIIGTITVSDAVKVGMTDEVTPQTIYRYYISSINMVAGKKVSDVKSLYHAASTFAADPFIDTVTNSFIIYNAGNSEFIWEMDKQNVKSLRDMDDSTKGSISLTRRKKISGVLDSTGTVVFNAPSGEYFKSISQSTIGILTLAGVSAHIDVSSLNTNVLPEKVEASLGSANSGKTFTLLIDVVSTNLAEKSKTPEDEAIQFPDAELSAYSLDRSDVYGVTVYVYDKTQPANKAVWKDVTRYFTIFNGQTDTTYINASLTRTATPLPITIIPSTHGLRVEYTFFRHSGSQGFFNVDSYSSVGYDKIPKYTAKSGKVYSLTDCFDFRPLIISNSVQSVAIFPSIGQVAIFDIEHYIGRVDSVCLRKDGGVTIYHGDPAEVPKPAVLSDDWIVLYELYLKPYTFNLQDISIKYVDNRVYTMRDINKIENRLASVEYYTVLSLLEKSAKDMSIKDINGLDRFKNGFVVDDFSNFQVGESASSEFKACLDTRRKELRPSYTSRSRKMKLNTALSYGYKLIDGMAYAPWTSFVSDSQPFATKNISINPYFMTTKKGSMILSPNNDNWSDTTRLPGVQVNVDTGTTAALANVVDYNKIGVTYGAWVESNRSLINSGTDFNTVVSSVASTTVESSTQVTATSIWGGNLFGNSTATTSVATTSVATTATTTSTDTYAVNQSQSVKGIEVGSRTDTYQAGDRVTDVSLNPYMRSVDVEFYATRMLPTTKVWAFFDGTPVSANTRDITGEFGGQLVTDTNGSVHGIFRIPEGQFFVGEKTFKLTGDINNDGNVDTEFTKASSTFFSGGISVSKETLALNVVTPVLNMVDTVQSRTVNVNVPKVVSNTSFSSSSTTTISGGFVATDPPVLTPRTLIITANDQSRNSWDPEFNFAGSEFTVQGLLGGDSVTVAALSSDGAIQGIGGGTYPIQVSAANISNPSNYTTIIYQLGTFTVVEAQTNWNSGGGDGGDGGGDPLAQSFNFDYDNFVTGLDVYFERVDMSSKTIWAQLRTMHNGYPTAQVLAEQLFSPVDIAPYVSDNSQTPFHVDFKFPVYVRAGEDYCFVIGGASPNTRLWISRLGEAQIDNPTAIVETQPSLGSSFRSQNGTTWNAEQFEDIKYNIYSANFQSTEMSLDFVIDPEGEILEQDPFEYETGVNVIRVYMKDHGLTAGDTVGIGMFADETYQINSPSASKPSFGQTITTSTGSAVIDDVVTITSNLYNIRIKNLSGLILSGEAFECKSESLLGGIADGFTGTIATAPLGIIDGIDLKELNTSAVVKSVDGNNSFLISIVSTPTGSGRFGGLGVNILANYRYEIHNSSGQYEKYDASEVWRFTGVDSEFNKLNSKFVEMKTDYHLDTSNKILSSLNESRLGLSSIDLNCVFSTPSPLTSPVVNTNTFTTVFVSNSVDNADQNLINVKPNSVGRYKPETDANQGSHSYKYVTRKIILAKPASDMRIAFDAYKDYTADFDVYVKVQAQYSTDNIDDYAWRKVNIADKVHSVNLSDRIEYELTASELVDDWTGEFISFKVKIVGRTTNAAKPPLFQSLRVIAFT